MRYASDNKVVQALYGITTGPYKYLLILLVIVAAGVSLYFPIRDYYVAYRTNDILTRQLQLREAYNESLQSDVDQLLSTEGIENAARENLGLVMPGEKRIDVVGSVGDGADSSDASTGEDSGDASDAEGSSGTQDGGGADASGGDASQDDSSSGSTDAGTSGDSDGDATSDGSGSDDSSTQKVPTTSAELREAEAAIAEEAPWYIKALDTLFFYQGVDGQKVSSTGE